MQICQFLCLPNDIKFCQAQPSPNKSWAEVALVPIDPATHPPTHPQEKLKQALEISQTMFRQCLNIIRTVSGQCPDSVRTVSGQCLKGIWKVFET